MYPYFYILCLVFFLYLLFTLLLPCLAFIFFLFSFLFACFFMTFFPPSLPIFQGTHQTCIPWGTFLRHVDVFYRTTRCYIPEDTVLHNYCYENPNSSIHPCLNEGLELATPLPSCSWLCELKAGITPSSHGKTKLFETSPVTPVARKCEE
jgi:hypothetical protein